MKRAIALSVGLFSTALANSCGEPPVVENGSWHCPEGRRVCVLGCSEGFGIKNAAMEISGKKIKCNNGVWETLNEDADAFPSCSATCPAVPEEYKLLHSSLKCHAVGGGTCTPGVDCVEGDECLIVCKEGFELNPMPKRDNGLQCTCNTIKCKWTGQGRKLVDHTCVPKKSVRIINGEDGERGKDGYTISLGYYGQNKENKKEWIHFCGGVLLTSQWGITAAHCQQRNLKAMIGEYKLNEREGSEVLCRVQKQIRHPQYDFRTQNDVMMINVKCNKLEMGKFIYPARLPAPGVDPKAGDNCRICGWGNTDYPTYVPAKTLQCVTLPVIDTDTCNGPDHYINSIHDKIMCIGNLKEGGKDSCQGDSGGPANCGGIIHGIVMGGLYCAKPNYPGVYTRTNRYIDWMKSTISENSSSRKRSKSRGNRRNKGRRYGGK